MCHPEYLADLTQIQIISLELESRSARRHFQSRNLCEGIEYFLGDTIAEVGGVFILAQIFKWQNRDRLTGRLVRRRGGCLISSALAAEKKKTDRQKAADNHHIKPNVLFWSPLVRKRNVPMAFNSLRCYFKHPGEDQRDWQPYDYDENNQANRPVRNIEHRKDLCDSLRKRPAADDIGNCDLVNVAPLQLGKERGPIVHVLRTDVFFCR